MPDTQISSFTADTTPAGADLIVTAKSPFGAGSNRKVTWANVFANAQMITFPTGSAVTATDYSIGRNADATNRLQLNVPIGSSIEFSTGDAQRALITSDGFNAGTVLVGTGSVTNANKLEIIQGAGAGSGGLKVLKATGGAHTSMQASTELIDVLFDLSRTVQFATGALAIQRAFVIEAPTYSFVGASDLDLAMTVSIDGMPLGGTNTTLDSSYGLVVGNVNNFVSNAEEAVSIVSLIPGISDGMGAADLRSGLIIAAPGNISLGNQTATLDELNSVHISSVTYESTTNIRTVLMGSSLYVQGPPVNGGNIVFSGGPYSLLVDDGESRFDGNIEFGAGNAITAGDYMIGRDADATNQLHFNVPTGAEMEFSVNDVLAFGIAGAQALFVDGTAGTPSLAADGDRDTGFYWNGVNGIGVTGGGVSMGTWTPTAMTIAQAAASSGSPVGFTFTGAAHTGLDNTEFKDAFWDLSRTVTFTGGGGLFEAYGVGIDIGTTYAASAAQTLDTAYGVRLIGTPQAGTNIMINTVVGLFMSDGAGSNADAVYNTAITTPAISAGTGSVSERVGLLVDSDGVSLGNQTATLDHFYPLLLAAPSVSSTTNVRTVVNSATLKIENAPVSTGNISFTNTPLSLWVEAGPSRFDGALLMTGSTAANGIRLNSSPYIYSNAAETIKMMESTDDRGLNFVLSASGVQMINVDAGVAAENKLSLQDGTVLTITPGRLWAAVDIKPRFAQENFEHYGLHVNVTQNGANTQPVYGIMAAVSGGNGTDALLAAIAVDVPATAGTVTDAMGLRVLNIGAASHANSYGIYIEAQSGSATINDGIYIANASRYSIFADAGLARFDDGIAIDGATTKNVTSGTYTPTRSAEANLDSNVTMTEAQYMRVGNTVTVSGRFTADPTLTATTTSFEITLPVASNIGAVEDVAGTAFCGNIAGMGAEVMGVAANDTAKIVWKASDVTSQTWSYIFTYYII